MAKIVFECDAFRKAVKASFLLFAFLFASASLLDAQTFLYRKHRRHWRS